MTVRAAVLALSLFGLAGCPDRRTQTRHTQPVVAPAPARATPAPRRTASHPSHEHAHGPHPHAADAHHHHTHPHPHLDGQNGHHHPY